MPIAATAASPEHDIIATLQAMLGAGELKYKIACTSHDDAMKLRQRMNHIRRMDRRRAVEAQREARVPQAEINDRSIYDKMVFQVPARAAYVLIHIDNGPGLQSQLSIIDADGTERPFQPEAEAPDAGAIPANFDHSSTEEFDL